MNRSELHWSDLHYLKIKWNCTDTNQIKGLSFPKPSAPIWKKKWLLSLISLSSQQASKLTIHSFFYKHTGKLGWSSICLRFSNFSLKLCLLVCFISKLVSWFDIVFDMNTAMVSFKCSNLNIQLSLTWTLQWSL